MNKIQEIIDFIRGVEMSQIINLIIALSIIIVFLLLSPIIAYGIVKIFLRKQTKEDIKNTNIFKAIKNFIGISGVYVASKVIELEQFQNAFIDKCFVVVIIWTIARIVAGAFEARKFLIDKITKNEINKKNAFFTSVVSIIVKVVLYIIAVYLTLKEFGYDIGGLATGLGLTGAVVALAAQDFIKQIISGLSIFIDKPFQVGDWIDVENASGTVEDITIKSTKIRTTEDTIITVPNDLITSSNVVNWGRIGKRVFRANLKFALETEEKTIEKVINRIKFILRYNEDIIAKSINIQVLKIEHDAINVDIYLETTITKYADYRNFCNKINLTILNILETQGINLSYPSQNIYIKENTLEGKTIGKEKISTDKSIKEKAISKDKNKKSVKPAKISK